MAIPASAKQFPESMDPNELLDYEGDLAGNLLQEGEEIATYSLALLADAVSRGLVIRQDGDYAPQVVDATAIKAWLEIPDAGDRLHPSFDSGFRAGLELTVTTTNVPPRRRQRTLVVEIIQQ